MFCLAGSRSRIYSFMFSAGLAGMSIGPCAAAATFAITGNTWHVTTLQHVILVGMVLAVVPVLALLCFDDDLSLGAESDAVRHQSAIADQQGTGTGETDLHVSGDSQPGCCSEHAGIQSMHVFNNHVFDSKLPCLWKSTSVLVHDTYKHVTPTLSA